MHRIRLPRRPHRPRRPRTRLAALLTATAVAALGLTGISSLVAAPVHAGLDGPMATDIDQHCLLGRVGSGPVRPVDHITVRIESLHGGGWAWVDYEVPGSVGRQAGPRGGFDPQSRAVSFTFPIHQQRLGAPIVIYAGSVWSDGTTHQNQFNLTMPASCGQTSGNSEGTPHWGNFAEVTFNQHCALVPGGGSGAQLRWVSRVTATLAPGRRYDFQPGAAWVDYWVSSGGRAEYGRGAQGYFNPGSRTLTLTFDVPTGPAGTELGIVGSLDWDGRSKAAHAWAPLKRCDWEAHG